VISPSYDPKDSDNFPTVFVCPLAVITPTVTTMHNVKRVFIPLSPASPPSFTPTAARGFVHIPIEALAKPPSSVLQAQHSEASIQNSELEPSHGHRVRLF
jgi:hypothetical protein